MTAHRVSSLFILGFLLLASISLRLGSNLGQALAAAEAEPQTTSGPQSCPASPVAVTEALRLRDEKLRAEEIALADKQAALTLAGEIIDQRMAALTQAEAELAATLAKTDGAAERDIARMTAVYEAMKPKAAAAILGGMAPEFSSGFLARMRPDAAAPVLAAMPPEQAYAISALIAGRNAGVPRE